MRRWLLAPLALLLLGSNPSNETVPPQCTVSDLAAGTCAPSKLGTRVRISNGNVATGDTNCAVGTGAFTILCEFDGANWIQVIPGTATETNTLTTVTTGIADDQVPVGTAANVAAYKSIPSCSAEGETLNYDIATNSFVCLVDGGAVGGTVSVVGNCNGPNCFDGSEGDTLTSTTSETINLATQNTFIFGRNDAGTVTLQGADNASPANTIYSTTGAGTATLGGPSVNLANIVSNNDVEIELDDDSTGSTQSLVVRDGSNAQVFSINELGAVTINLDPSLAFTDAVHAGPPAAAGQVRLENTHSICFRNAANTGDECQSVNSSNQYVIDQPLILANQPTTAELDFREGGGGTDALRIVAPASITTGLPACVLENDASFIPDSCVGDGVDGGASETNTLTDITTGIANNEMPMGIAANDVSYVAMPTTGTNGCSGPGEALQYNTGTHTWTCTTDLAGNCIDLQADEITCAFTDGCTAGTIHGTDNSFVTANFTTAFDSSGTWNFPVPNGWAGHTLSVEIDWTSDHADCNNEAADDVCFAFDSGSVTNDGAFVSPSLGGTLNGLNDTCITNGDLMQETRTGYIHGMTDGQRGIFKLSRDVAGTTSYCASADDFTQEAKVIGVRLCRE